MPGKLIRIITIYIFKSKKKINAFNSNQRQTMHKKLMRIKILYKIAF